MELLAALYRRGRRGHRLTEQPPLGTGFGFHHLRGWCASVVAQPGRTHVQHRLGLAADPDWIRSGSASEGSGSTQGDGEQIAARKSVIHWQFGCVLPPTTSGGWGIP